jgi:predicted dienelactone hydrolase
MARILLLCGALCAWSGACAAPAEAPQRPELAWPVTSAGGHNVGQRVFEVTYAPTDEGAMRSLRVVVWYPTAASSSAAPAPLFHEGDVFVDAEPLPGPLPVALFSHGVGAIAEVGSVLAEHLASHGFLVAAPSHTGDTTVNAATPRTTAIFYLRPLDLSAVLDALAALPADDLLAGRAGSDVVVIGHSFGGYTALVSAGAVFADEAFDGCARGDGSALFCSEMTPKAEALFRRGFGDPRIRAAIPIAAGDARLLLPGGAAAIDVPVMLLTGAQDRAVRNADNGDRYWEELAHDDNRRVDFANTGHDGFISLCLFAPSLSESGGCEPERLDPRASLRLVNSYALAFARLHLFGDESVRDIVDGAVALHDDAKVSRP